MTDGFDFPLGPPNGSGYRVDVNFGNHLGEDWNRGNEDDDCGDDVHAVSNGQVVVSGPGGTGWGDVILIQHDTPDGIRTSMYAHLSGRNVSQGDTVTRGQKIGDVGKTGGPWVVDGVTWNYCHLHWEIRLNASTSLGSGYGSPAQGQVDPSDYINAHRPPWGGDGDTTPPTVDYKGEPNKSKWFSDADFHVVEWHVTDDNSGVKGFRQRWKSQSSDYDSGYSGLYQGAVDGDLKFNYIPEDRREGKHTAWVEAEDNAGNKKEWSSGAPGDFYGYDNTPPTVTITSPQQNGGVYDQPQRIEWKVDDGADRSGLKNWTQAWDSAAPQGPFTSTTGWLDLDQGTHVLHVHAWDNVGKDKDWTWTFTYQPKGTLSITTTSNTNCPVNGPVSVNGGVFVNQSWGNAPQSRTVNTGTYTVSFGAVSGYKTPDPQAATVTKDTTTPINGVYEDQTAPIINVTAPAVNTCLPPPQTVSWTTADICTAGLTVQYSWDGGPSQTTSLSGSLTVPHGNHTLKLMGTDSAGNMCDITVGPFIVDTTPPSAPTGVTVATGHYSASVSWTPPQEDGCATVKGYNVFHKRNDGDGWTQINTTLWTNSPYPDRVANGVSYIYGVQAVDTFGRPGEIAASARATIGAPGDLNGDGEIDISDVIIAINVIANPNATAVQKALADYDRSGVADAADVEAMKKTILEK